MRHVLQLVAQCVIINACAAQVGDASAAEGECEAMLERARQAEPSSPEPLQVRCQGGGWCGAWRNSRQCLCFAAHNMACL